MLRLEMNDRTVFTFNDVGIVGTWDTWNVRHPRALFVGAYGGSFRISKIELTELDQIPPGTPSIYGAAASAPSVTDGTRPRM